MIDTQSSIHDLTAKVADLESQLAFQDDTIQQLDEALSQQQKDILLLVKTVNLLRDDLKKAQLELAEGQEIINTKPPHY